MALVVKKLPVKIRDARDSGSVPELGKYPGVGNGNPLQYSCLEKSHGQRAWGTIVHRVANSWIRLSDWAHKVLRGELPGGWAGKESACNAGDPGSGRSPGEGIGHPLRYFCASLVTQLVKNSPAKKKKKKEFTYNVGDLGSIPGLGRSPGEGKGYPLQYSGLENSMDCIVHGVKKSRTWLSDFHTQKCKKQILFKENLR